MKKKFTSFITAVIFLLSNAFASLATTLSFTPVETMPIALPDNDATGITRTFVVSGVPANATVNSVTISLDIAHTWVGDLRAELTSPDSESHILFYDIGDTNSPVNAADSSNLSGIYTFSDTATNTLWTEALNGTSQYNCAPGTYRTTSMNSNTATNMNATFGYPGTPLADYLNDAKLKGRLTNSAPQATNGTWTLTISDNQSPDSGTLAQATLTIDFTPTSAGNVSIQGRLLTSSGKGLTNALVNIRDVSTGELKTVRSSAFGYFNISGLYAGQTYTIDVISKRYRFNQQVISLAEDVTNLIIQAQE